MELYEHLNGPQRAVVFIHEVAHTIHSVAKLRLRDTRAFRRGAGRPLASIRPAEPGRLDAAAGHDPATSPNSSRWLCRAERTARVGTRT